MVKKRSAPAFPAFDFGSALTCVRRFFPPTALTHSPALSELADREVYLKWDNKLRTGSFKERGAVNFLSNLSSTERRRGVCAASAGNHALALSYYARKFRIPCTLVMPVFAPLVKVQASKRLGAEVISYGNNFDEAYTYAEDLARRTRKIYVPAFDHPKIIEGQGTAGLEIMDQLPDVDAIVVPIGGGGLISGIGLAVKGKRPRIGLIGVQSEWAVKARATISGHLSTQFSGTIADGIAVKRVGVYTDPIMKSIVDSFVAVSENEIANAVVRVLEHERTVVEGAGAAGVAALLSGKIPKRYKRIAIMACGSNIDMNVLSRLIERDMAQHDRLLRLKVSLPDRPGSLRRATGILAEQGGNVLEVIHDRSFSREPVNVDISFVLEVRDARHRGQILAALAKEGLTVQAED